MSVIFRIGMIEWNTYRAANAIRGSSSTSRRAMAKTEEPVNVLCRPEHAPPAATSATSGYPTLQRYSRIRSEKILTANAHGRGWRLPLTLESRLPAPDSSTWLFWFLRPIDDSARLYDTPRRKRPVPANGVNHVACTAANVRRGSGDDARRSRPRTSLHRPNRKAPRSSRNRMRRLPRASAARKENSVAGAAKIRKQHPRLWSLPSVKYRISATTGPIPTFNASFQVISVHAESPAAREVFPPKNDERPTMTRAQQGTAWKKIV